MTNKLSCKLKRTSVAMVIVMILVVASVVSLIDSGVRLARAASNTSAYSSREEMLQAGSELNAQISEEGMVLLKNDGTLPLATGKGTNRARVSLFGYASVYPAGGGSAEGGDVSGGVSRISTDIYQSFKDAGFAVNEGLRSLYTNWTNANVPTSVGMDMTTYTSYNNFARGDYRIFKKSATEYNAFLASARQTYANYSDAAIVVLGQTSLAGNGAMGDIEVFSEMTGINVGTVVPGAHKQQLDEGQLAILNEAIANFDKVIVVINSSKPIELAPVQSNAGVDAIILAGEPGNNGFTALGKIISGAVNPSGRLTDNYAADYTQDPTWFNWARNGVVGLTTPPPPGNPYASATQLEPNGNQYVKAEAPTEFYPGASFVDYKEGIYLGYRYYETKWADMATGADAWYLAHVVYPFGFGLSYTEFDWDVDASSDGATITKDGKISIDINVTNVGDYAGKDVVEAFFTAPYDPTHGIEKSHVVLGDFTKTKLLAPGESQIVTISFDARDMASYDWKVAKTYVLEAGNYKVKLSKNAHEVVDIVNYTVAATVRVDSSKTTGTEITNVFDDVNDAILSGWRGTDHMSRATGLALPARPTLAMQKLTAAQYELLQPGVFTEQMDIGKPYYVSEANRPQDFHADASTRPAVATLKLPALIGAAYDDPRWDTLINQLTIEEVKLTLNAGGHGVYAIDYIGKPYGFDTDGPAGWTGTGVNTTGLTRFATEPVVASTYNKELAFELGAMIGEQGIWANNNVTTGGKTYTGWYAPAMNTHRAIFDQRYTEYYSEDGYLAGIMGANASLGANSKGAFVYIKHFVFHEDGNLRDRGSSNNRSGLNIWADEQTAREIYLKPFQIATEKGEARGAMSTFSRIGFTWGGGSYALLTQLLRQEWGFKGIVITDINMYSFLNTDQMLRAGGDLLLSVNMPNPASNPYQQITTTNMSATQLSAVRRALKNVLYVTANTNSMNVPVGASVNYAGIEAAGAKVGDAYSADFGGATLSTLYAYSSVSYSVTAGKLPAGLTLNATTGAVTGTPTAEGTFSFTVTASAADYTAKSAEYTITVAPAVSLLESVTAIVETALADASTDTQLQAILDAIGELPEGATAAQVQAAITSATSGLSTSSKLAEVEAALKALLGDISADVNAPVEPAAPAASAIEIVGAVAAIVALVGVVALLVFYFFGKKKAA